MNRVRGILLASCILVFVLNPFHVRAMRMDFTSDELLECWEDSILIEKEDNTEFDSLDKIREEIVRRKKNWEELVTQEWGVSFSHTEVGYSDLNLGEYLGLWDAQAIVFTPFRISLATDAVYKKVFGDEAYRKSIEQAKESPEEEVLEEPRWFGLGLIVRVPTYSWEFPPLNYLALLRYKDKELKPTFSYRRESTIYYTDEVQRLYKWTFGGGN